MRDGDDPTDHEVFAPLPLTGEYDEQIAASRAARRSYRGASLGLPIAGPRSLASFGERFWGLIIDNVCMIPFVLVLRPLTAATRVEPRVVGGGMEAVVVQTGRPAAAALLLLVPRAIYVIVAIGAFGRTLGQRASNIEVVTVGGDPPGWARAVRRWSLIGGIDAAALLTGRVEVALAALVVCGWMLVSPNRQGLHDLLGGVIVVRAEKPRD